MALVNAVLECVTGSTNKPQVNHSGSRSVVPTQMVVADSINSAAVGSAGAVIDVTKSRRSVRKPAQKEASEVASQVASPALQSDSPLRQPLKQPEAVSVAVPIPVAVATPAFSDAQLRAFVRTL